MKRRILTTAVLAMAAASTALVSTSALAAWTPKKPIEFVIMAGKGGGADKMARLMQSIIAKHKMSPRPLVPVNKSGGSGAEALVHMKGKTGDDHTIMVTLNSFYTTPMRQPNLGVDPLTFTPVGRMAEDTFLVWVSKDSGIKTFDEFVSAAKAAGNKWIMAGTGKGQEDQLLTSFLNRTFSLDMKYVPYKGGGRVAKELAGNHANSTVNNPSEQLGFYEAGKTVPLAAFTPERLPLFADAPTMGELGHKYSYFMQRSVVGAPGMSADAAAFYQGLFKKVYDSEEWQTYMKKKSLQGDFMSGDALVSYWKQENARHEGMLREIGEIK
jgi:putative tricarboxylic transport membrane protein